MKKAEQAREEGFVMEIVAAPKGYFDSDEHLKFELAYEKAFFSGQKVDPMHVAWNKWKTSREVACH